MQTSESGTNLDQALGFVNETIRDGLAHGYFSITIRGERVSGGRKRKLTVEAGKNVQFTIQEDEIHS